MSSCLPEVTPQRNQVEYRSDWEDAPPRGARRPTEAAQVPSRGTGQGPRAASCPLSSRRREQRGTGTPLGSRRRTAPGKFPGPAAPPAAGKFLRLATGRCTQRTRAARDAATGRAGPRSRAQRDPSPPVEGLAHRSSGDVRVGRSRDQMPSLDPSPDLDSRPKTPPRRPYLKLQPPAPCGPCPTPGPSLPGARRGRLRSAAPAPGQASLSP